MRSIATDVAWSVCLSVYVIYGQRFLVAWRCDMLCTSDFKMMSFLHIMGRNRRRAIDVCSKCKLDVGPGIAFIGVNLAKIY